MWSQTTVATTPPLKTWFLGSSGNFKQLLFLEKQFFFFSKFFFHLQKNFPTFNSLCISRCFMPSWVLKKTFTQNFFSLKIFLGQERRDTMLPSISSFRVEVPTTQSSNFLTSRGVLPVKRLRLMHRCMTAQFSPSLRYQSQLSTSHVIRGRIQHPLSANQLSAHNTRRKGVKFQGSHQRQRKDQLFSQFQIAWHGDSTTTVNQCIPQIWKTGI